MQQMGWQQGQGLGARGEGLTNYLQTRRKHDNLGIGATQSQADENWIATQSMYNDILKKLQIGVVGEGGAPVNTAPEPADRSTGAALKVALERRRLYSRFTKAKDVGSYSEESLKEILGKTDGNSNSSSAGSRGSGSGSADPSAPEVDEYGRPIEHAETSSLITVTSTVSLTDYFASRVNDKLATLKTSTASSSSSDDKLDEFSESPRGFSMQDQANYYDSMMRLTQTGRGGLGHGGARNRNPEQDEVDSYASRKRPSAVDDYYSERNQLLRKLASSSDKKPKEWSMSSAVPMAEVVDNPTRSVIRRPSQIAATKSTSSNSSSNCSSNSSSNGNSSSDEKSESRKRKKKSSDSSDDESTGTKRVCGVTLPTLHDDHHEEIHTIVKKHIDKSDGVASLEKLVKRVSKKGKREEYKEVHVAQYLAKQADKVVVALASHAVHADNHDCEHYRAVHTVFRKVAGKVKKSASDEGAELIAMPLSKLSRKLKKHLPDHVVSHAKKSGHDVAATSLAALAKSAGEYILISFHPDTDE